MKVFVPRSEFPPAKEGFFDVACGPYPAPWEIAVGDNRKTLAMLPAESVHCVVTSPPYWGLRSYGVGTANGELGLESSLDEFLRQQVAVFREVWRVLRDDGTCWVNMGDSYAQSRGSRSFDDGRPGTVRDRGGEETGAMHVPAGFKEKDLLGQPWRLAFALQADGWYLRSDIVWCKPAPMPESIKDRPTRAHEYLFLLSKQPRYFYDNDAVREPYKADTLTRRAAGDASNVGSRRSSHQPEQLLGGFGVSRGAKPPEQDHGYLGANPLGANKRDFWIIAGESFQGGHFATFPTKLVEPCILAGTSEFGVCTTCAAPYRRVVEKGEPDLEWQQQSGGDANGEYSGESEKHGDLDPNLLADAIEQGVSVKALKIQNASDVKARILAGMRKTVGVRWEPTCGHRIECSTCKGVGATEMQIEWAIALCGLLPVLGPRPVCPNPACRGRGWWAESCEEKRQREDELYGARAVVAFDAENGGTPAEDLEPDPTVISARPCSDCGHERLSHGQDADQCGYCRCQRFKFTKDADHVQPATVLDPYSGAATTGVVARRFGRRYLGCELNEKYALMSAERLEADAERMERERIAAQHGIADASKMKPTEVAAGRAQMGLFDAPVAGAASGKAGGS